MPKMIQSKQSPTKKEMNAAPVKYAVGSGSRPTGGKVPIHSSAPSSAKRFRG